MVARKAHNLEVTGSNPTTSQLTADRSTTELLRNNGLKEAGSRSLDQPMTEQKGVRHSFSHTPGERVTIASPSPAGEPPEQGGGDQPSTLEIHIDQSISASCQFAK